MIHSFQSSKLKLNLSCQHGMITKFQYVTKSHRNRNYADLIHLQQSQTRNLQTEDRDVYALVNSNVLLNNFC